MKPNFKCGVCGKEYYVCKEGITKFPFLQVVCSAECHNKWKEKIAARKKKAAKKTASVAKTVSPVEEAIEE